MGKTNWFIWGPFIAVSGSATTLYGWVSVAACTSIVLH